MNTAFPVTIQLFNHLTNKLNMAEGVGFEPTEVLPSTVFKTAAFDHSAIPPRIVKLQIIILHIAGQYFYYCLLT